MKALVRLVPLAIVVVLAGMLVRRGPKEVVLVYDLARTPGATALEVTLRRGAEEVRRAEFRFDREPNANAPRQVEHPVKLRNGDYVLAFRLDVAGTALHGERPLTVTESGTIVLPLGP